jgi:hypothetical protein
MPSAPLWDGPPLGHFSMTELQIRQGIAEKLQPFNDQMDALINLVSGAPLRGPEKEKAQRMLKELKDSLKEACRASKDFEHPFGRLYYSAVSQASATISVKTNSVPSPEWVSELYSAQVDITHAIAQCK